MYSTGRYCTAYIKQWPGLVFLPSAAKLVMLLFDHNAMNYCASLPLLSSPDIKAAVLYIYIFSLNPFNLLFFFPPPPCPPSATADPTQELSALNTSISYHFLQSPPIPHSPYPSTTIPSPPDLHLFIYIQYTTQQVNSHFPTVPNPLHNITPHYSNPTILPSHCTIP